MKIAIAILNWNGKSWLEKFLPNVLENSQSAEVYVIDNASTDDSVAYISTYFPSVKIVVNQQNHGFAGGYNEGLKQIHSDIYCLLNSDVEVTPGWLDPVAILFEKNPDIAAIQPKILDYNRKNFFEFAGAGGGLIDNLGYPYCRGRVFENVEEDKGQYNDETEIFWASGCCLFIRSEDFWNQNGFDARFFAHQEEIDLCWRLKNSGRKIYYTGKSAIYHVGGGTLQKQNPRKTYLNIRNNLSMMLKNLPSGKLYLIFIRLCLDGIAGIYFMFKHGFSHTWAVIKAHFGFYAQLPGTLKLRQQNQIKDYYQSKWLIFKHFLKGE
ncbi:dTDP-Rha--alpha-D-GlcNAc-pyrophosphate polyprenol alpha-3-L-rhamnosyltransferase [Elizabethkingia anophelis]|uniref:glycosyltransferase family 2 protein n=1 Tax=Elizabethkingia anophelis TaxID=1117645 RepID=UPI000CE94440|nr:glycosyltransferase family 2 protein [Elizabethkingia anophelis]AVF50063.1 dTDP-Rha--alpha-D-GlcNAc-pyrophosphate polyprenol alpha-3-L-rhamnosyltransferase [Elizabethkingia anophelis]AVF53651.1 dTDP-Rha--alpha-D-GlcNAc-pyrophosphate polyprenol alpha-3-L-rhamnosyltransferase [Elizabethkingia anophelis]MCT4071617.1 glycosyltransferase family 2 protein [Elizabethkingia anophelis]MDV3900595.1 dTDP-Rha--alpha-D-GlcNAc-pyrophosphate polyprenol alpha-3-L-rhamnosyltransferase [Elizabethkingia anophe